MTLAEDDRWLREKALLADLVEAGPVERQRHLAALERLAPQRARRLRALLEHEPEADSAGFLKPVREDPGRYVPELAALPAGARVGPFRVERVHAVGGASVV